MNLTSPIAVLFQITPQCNHKCIFCLNSWRKSNVFIKQLGLEQKKEIIKDISKAKAFRIIFSGGEPTLDKDLPQLIEFAKKSNLNVVLETNGTFNNSKLFDCIITNVDGLQISLEGLEKTHNIITGSDNYSLIINNIKQLIKNNVNLSINITINKKNHQEIGDLIEYLNRLGVKEISFTRLYFAGSAIKNFKYLTLNPTEYSSFLKKTIKKYSKLISIKIQGPLPPPYIREHSLKLPNHPSCVAGISELTIGPQGDYFLCPSSNKKLGSFKEKSVFEFWNSKSFSYYRDRKNLPKKCFKCDDYSECKGGCILSETGDKLCPK